MYRYNDYLHDCKNQIYGVGDTVYYFDKKGEIRIGTVTRIRVEIDHKTLQTAKKVKAGFVDLKQITKEIQDA